MAKQRDVPAAAGTLLDAGPMAALFNRRDWHHEACREALKTITGPLLTVWPAVTEAMYLLAPSGEARERLFEFLLLPSLEFAALNRNDLPRIRELMQRYHDLPMDLADAALVRVAERDRIRRVFTLDHRGFRLYRPKHVRSLELLPSRLMRR